MAHSLNNKNDLCLRSDSVEASPREETSRLLWVFSIIIPVYDRPDELKDCLEAIRRLVYPRQYFEVLVVDDGSRICLDASHYVLPSDLNFRILRQNHSGPAAARNTGAGHAKGKYLAFLDVDCRPESDWLTHLENGFAKSSNVAVAGKILNGSPQSLLATASHLVLDCSFDFYNRHPEEVSFLASGNFAVTAALFREMGGFNRRFLAAEDREFCDYWRQRGLPLFFAREARVWHAHSVSIKDFLKRHFNYGRGAFLYHKLRAKRKLRPMRLAPAGFYLQLLYKPMRSVSFHKIPWLAFLMALSQLSSLIGFLVEGAEAQPLETIARPREDLD